MYIGLPAERKDQEHRVALTPDKIKILVDAGHCVAVGYNAGWEAGFVDQEYTDVGAFVVNNDTVWNHDLIVKVKEPLPEEYIKQNQIIFSYLHLAANKHLTETLIEQNATAIAFETILEENGSTPLLDPMSVIAGELSSHVGARYLQKNNGGRGILMSDARVTILGCGTAGKAAARIAAGMGANVVMLELQSNLDQAIEFVNWLPNQTHRAYSSTPVHVQEAVCDADVVIGCVHIPGAPTTRLVTEEMVKKMKRGSVMVDIAIDQGGCFETSYATSHSRPTYTKHDVIHYCVPNMPGIVPISASRKISDHIFPYLLKIIDDPLSVPSGVNVHNGEVVHPAVAKAHNL